MRALKQAFLAKTLAVVLVFITVSPAAAPRTELKPGINIFKLEHDIELGRGASAEAERQLRLLGDARVDAYLERLGRRLVGRVPGHNFPYEFRAVNDSAINAFALPGGFIYINRGTLEAAENEAQLAGVMAHEIAHVALRHGTNQLTKAIAWRAPLFLLSALAGDSGSLPGELARIGLAVGFTAVFLKYSRTAETQADLLATQLLFDTGFEPSQMGVFFRKLEAGETAGGGQVVEFFSDHPNPGNRVASVEEEIRKLGKNVGQESDSEEFQAIRRHLRSLPPAPKRRGG